MEVENVIGANRICQRSIYRSKISFSAKDIRFTSQGSYLDTTTLGIPKENAMIKSLGISAKNGLNARVELEGSIENIKWKQEVDALYIYPSNAYPAENAIVYRITFKK